MKLRKENVHMNRVVEKAVTQITVDDDFIVPDVKLDIERIIAKDCHIKIDNVNVTEGRAFIKGVVDFAILYTGSGETSKLEEMRLGIVFEEPINSDRIHEGDVLMFKTFMEDWNIGIINSRKIGIKGVINLRLYSEELYDIETAVDVEATSDVDYLMKNIDACQIAVSIRDTLRVKEEIEIVANKPNIGEILWSEVRIKNCNTRITSGGIQASGEVSVFILYKPWDDEKSFEWIEKEVPFAGVMEISGLKEDMIPYIVADLMEKNVDIRNDYDGEPRRMGVEFTIGFDIRAYSEEDKEIIKDIYSCLKKLTPICKPVEYNRILMRNQSKCRVDKVIRQKGISGLVMQICNSNMSTYIDRMMIVENGIEIDGVIKVEMLYISDDDRCPLNMAKGEVRFNHRIEVPGIKKDSICNINATLTEQQLTMAGDMEVEVKTNVILDAIVFEKLVENIIDEIKEEPLDMEEIKNMPGIVGYLVKEKDTLWNIAKQFYTTVESIKQLNNLKNETIKPGDVLIIVKRVAKI